MPTYRGLGDRPSTPTGLFHFGGDLRDLLGVKSGCYLVFWVVRSTYNARNFNTRSMDFGAFPFVVAGPSLVESAPSIPNLSFCMTQVGIRLD